nr:hypothetical protein [Anaerofilum sp. An201]
MPKVTPLPQQSHFAICCTSSIHKLLIYNSKPLEKMQGLFEKIFFHPAFSAVLNGFVRPVQKVLAAAGKGRLVLRAQNRYNNAICL